MQHTHTGHTSTNTRNRFISLYLGRPVCLPESDAAVHPTIPLPLVYAPERWLLTLIDMSRNFPSDHEWFGLTAVAPKKPQLTIALQQTISLCKIFQDAMSDIFSPIGLDQEKSSRVNRLAQLNLQLSRWYSELPQSLRWTRWASQSHELESHVVILQYVRCMLA